MEDISPTILSICIPTYNRLEKLKRQVESVLALCDQRFNIVISDNKSTDETINYLTSIKDERLLIIMHETPVPASINAYDAMIRATGRYAIVALDKDFIEGDSLVPFIDELEQSSVPLYGYCDLNSKPLIPTFEHIQPGINAFLASSYLCKHPTGYFFFTDRMKEELEKLKDLQKMSFPFTLDVICAHFASSDYPFMIAHTAMVQTETVEEASRKTSLSYNVENLWFAPKQVMERYKVFIEDLFELGLEDKFKKKVLRRLLKRSFDDATMAYAGTLQRESICLHYGVLPQRISLIRLLQISQFMFVQLKDLRLIREKQMSMLHISHLINIIQIIKYKIKDALKQ